MTLQMVIRVLGLRCSVKKRPLYPLHGSDDFMHILNKIQTHSCQSSRGRCKYEVKRQVTYKRLTQWMAQAEIMLLVASLCLLTSSVLSISNIYND